MKTSLDNLTILQALLDRGFINVTSAGRSTKACRLQHPAMEHWVSVKIAENAQGRMSTGPLVVHPIDARRVAAEAHRLIGVDLKGRFKGASSKYGGTCGEAMSVQSITALDDVLAILVAAADPSPEHLR